MSVFDFELIACGNTIGRSLLIKSGDDNKNSSINCSTVSSISTTISNETKPTCSRKIYSFTTNVTPIMTSSCRQLDGNIISTGL